jgi:hypothetical protein
MCGPRPCRQRDSEYLWKDVSLCNGQLLLVGHVYTEKTQAARPDFEHS